MADLCDYKIFKNDRFEILTDKGYKDFKGIIKGQNTQKLKLTFSNNCTLVCTPKHKIIVNSNLDWKYAKELSIGTKLFDDIEIVDLEEFASDDPVYEILHVDEVHRYFVNNILSSQCLILDELAFIPQNLIEDFWRSVYPIISSSKKSKIFIASTPNGTDNLFYKLYTDGLNNKSNWVAEKMLWSEIPGRDEKWREETIRSIGSIEAFEQEFNCVFLNSGDSLIDELYFNKLETECRDPEHIFDDGCYKIWEEPEANKIYTIGVDVAEGVGKDYSVINIFDITSLQEIKQVAIYASNKISPYEFTTKLNEICYHWGTPPVLIERNNCGAHVADQMYETHKYPVIVSFSPKTGKVAFDRLGIYSHTNTKFKGVSNMRYWVHDMKCVIFREKATLEELRTFQRNANGTWSAKPGYHDDRVMSMVWALLILHNEVIQKYYNVIEIDDNGKPKIIQLNEFVNQEFKGFINEYKTLNISDTWRPPMSRFESVGMSSEITGIEELQAQGWEIL